jgi:hypothetical protein
MVAISNNLAKAVTSAIGAIGRNLVFSGKFVRFVDGMLTARAPLAV